MASTRNPVGTFTAQHSDGTLESLTFSADKTAAVAHNLTWQGQTTGNAIERDEARRILKVWTVRGVLI